MAVKLSVKVQAEAAGEIPDMSSALANLNSTASEIADLRMLSMIEQAKGDIQQASSISVATAGNTISMAGNIMGSFNTSYELNGKNNDFACHTVNNNTVGDLNGYSESISFEESFIDGSYTFTEQGAEPESDPEVTADLMQTVMKKFLSEEIPAVYLLESMELKETGSNKIISFDLNEDAAKLRCENICRDMLDDPNILTNAASDYKTSILSGYISIDTAIGLPVGFFIDYGGVYTIDGVEYAIGESFSEKICLGSNSSYKAIYGEEEKEAEPEEKASPLFYHVTNEDGRGMWLLGTVHVGDKRTAYLPEEIYSAFDAYDSLAVEFDIQQLNNEIMSDPANAQQYMEYLCYTDGTKL